MTRALVVAEHEHGELSPATRMTVSAALALAPESIDIAVLAGEDEGGAVAAAAATISGVACVRLIERAENAPYLASTWAPQIAGLGADYSHVFAPASTFGKDLLPRSAALMGVSAVSGICAIDGAYRFQRPVYAGNAIAHIEADPKTRILATIQTTAFPDPGQQDPAPVRAETSPVDLPAHTRFVERRTQASTGPDLSSASCVVAGGRGLNGSDGVETMRRLAEQLGAAVGASRAAVDSGWMPNELQVGQTGKIIAPELYVAIGISGAIQHLTGIKDAGTIVAINKDEHAPICEIADLVLVADLFAAVPELIEKLSTRRAPPESQ